MMVPKNNKNAYTVPTVGSGSSFASMFKPMIKSTTVKVVLNNKDKIKCIFLFYTINDPNTIPTTLATLIYNIKTHPRSEEHTSELQSRFDLVCRLLLEKKKNKTLK